MLSLSCCSDLQVNSSILTYFDVAMVSQGRIQQMTVVYVAHFENCTGVYTI